MTTETENPTWGEEPPPRADAPGPRWSGRKTLVAVAIAVGIAAVGGGVIYAASNSEAAQMMGGPRGYGGPGGGLRIMGGGPFGDAAHGEFQNGEITAVTGESITVKSADGFSQTYKVDDNTEVNGAKGDTDGLAAGDKVMVVAQDDVAKTVLEGDFLDGGRRPGDGQGQPGRRPGDGQQTPPTR